MNRQPYCKPPRWWSPLPSPFWMWVWKPLRVRQQRINERVLEVRVEGLEHVREAARAGQGVLITPNHPGHADCYLLWDALVRLRRPCYVMTAWQVFQMAKPLDRFIYRQHGCFSVDREGTDLQAFRLAVQVLTRKSDPLVIFPEGDVYHLNERVTPFREGTGTAVLQAVKRSGRPVAAIPCALKYEYLRDPTPELSQVMTRLESRYCWPPREELPLAERIERFSDVMLQIQERERLGATQSGSREERMLQLAEQVLSRIEGAHGGRPVRRGGTNSDRRAQIPERVKELRQAIIQREEVLAEQLPAHDPERDLLRRQMEDLFFVVQLYSYPADYVGQRPTVERMAETIDKFEEDFLGAATASVRGTRRGRVVFGEPMVVREAGSRREARQLTQQLEERVQQLLDRFQAVDERQTA